MTVTTTIDTSRLNARVSQLHDALIGAGRPGDAANILKDENRRLIKQIVNFTPPNHGRHGSQSRRVGEGAVMRDINRAVKPITPDAFSSERLSKAVKRITRAGNLTALEKIVRKVIDAKARVVRFTHLLHRNNRDSRGRVISNKHLYTADEKELRQYRKRIVSHVGRMIAALMPSYEAAGGVMRTPWVNRHRGKTAGATQFQWDGQKPFIRTIWRTPGAKQMQHIVTQAVRARSEAIGKRIRLVVSGYNREIRRKIIISRQAHKSAQFADTGSI